MLVISPRNAGVNLPGDDGIVFVLDHQPPSDFKINGDFETGSIYQNQSYNSIEHAIKYSGIDVKHVYMDHYLHWQDFPYSYTCVPNLFLRHCEDFLINATLGEYSDEQCCFIMMNKRRENRLLVSAWFSQHNDIDFDYSQGWDVEDKDFLDIQEYTRLTSYTLDSFLDKKFTAYKDNVTSNEDPNGYHDGEGNVAIWNNVLKEQFCSSTFSVITEPPFWEKGCMITEKYLMTLYGCCFPIFCGGGYGLADQLSGVGFDVFDDVINHSYQYELHPGQRVLHALEQNREILKKHSVKKLNYMERHLKNLSLVREYLNSFKDKFSNSTFEKYWLQLVDASVV